MLKRNLISHYTFPFYNSLFVLAALAPFIFVLISFIPNYQISAISKIFIPKSEEISLYLYVINTNYDNLTRAALSYENWGKDFTNLYPNSLLRIASPLDLPTDFDFQFTTTWNYSIKPIQNHLKMFIEGLKDFYFSTDLEWFARTTEDCLVDIRRLSGYISELSALKNPRKDYVLKGHLHKSSVKINGTNFAYIKGTSGWLMSRSAAKHFIDHEEEFLENFFSGDYVKGDDVITYDMMISMNLSFQEVQSNAFLSLPLDDKSLTAIISKDYTSVRECVQSDNKYLTPDIPLKSVIFFYNDKELSLANAKGFGMLSDVPDLLNVEIIDSKASICWPPTGNRKMKYIH